MLDDGNFKSSWSLGWNETLGGGWGYGDYVLDYQDNPVILVGSYSYQSDIFDGRSLEDSLAIYDNLSRAKLRLLVPPPTRAFCAWIGKKISD